MDFIWTPIGIRRSSNPSNSDDSRDSRVLSAASGHNWIPSAVENGLLRAIASSAQLHLDACINSEADLLVNLIYVSLIYYRIPAAIDAALRDIDVLTNKGQALVDLTHKRLAVVEMFDSPEYVPLKACDNLEVQQCAIISDKTRFQRCSGCLCFYYCSQECQIIDWRVGGHQEACNMYGAHCLTRLPPRTGPPRLLCRYIPTGLITRFNYTGGPLRITMDSKLGKQDVANAELVHSVARAGRSAGRLAPHVVRIADGRVTHTLLMPLRRSRAGVETH
ncbi:hypothetical protein B0H17DRAFT_1288782 [Mycena rosella]|uniref:MYND-type domain-containing protein n=1 Tax=Mycena rosella TaxID=1033263 RepID=A0AAD7BL42_MYCRO|nr:hypothetical protein B0H17DRAFT_1288782 [Mycena rosella]